LPTRPYPPTGGRTPGGGKKEPGILTALEQLLREETAGDPASERKWVRHSIRYLTAALRRQGTPSAR